MIDIRLLSGALGAEINGIDLTDVSDENFKKINDLLLEHKVIFFRDQPLTTEEREMLLGLISEMTPGKKEGFCKSFRFAFKLGDDAKVAPAITSRKHQAWIQQNA